MDQRQFQDEASQIRRHLTLLALGYLGDTDEAEDVVQDVLLRLWSMHHQIHSPMEALAMTMTRNVCIDTLRRRRRAGEVEERAIASDAPPDPTLDRMMEIVDSLPTMQQTILRLRHMEGMDIATIAKLTGTTETALRKALSRARIAVRDKMRKIKDD